MNKSISPLTFIDKLVKKNELGQPFKLFPHQREILNLAFTFDENGKVPYDTVVFSCPKKSGKTTLNAALTLWWALIQEAPNECLVVANDLEQAKGRAFASCEGIIEHNQSLKPSVRYSKRIFFSIMGRLFGQSVATIKEPVEAITVGFLTRKYGP
jgi:phage terminase large subunit-like protein